MSTEIGTVESVVEDVDNWDRMNEIWSQGKGSVESKPEVIDSWELMSKIWTERFGKAAGEKIELKHDSPYVPLSKTNISNAVDTSEEEEDKSWISWFCSQRGNKFLCQVADDFILDDFNLCGLSKQVPYYDKALDLILDEESSSHEEHNELIESAAEMLYGMIHARFLLTLKGLRFMLYKYDNHEFGRCPRVNCRGQPCLPIGLSDIPQKSKVKIFCPKCEEVYDPRSKHHGNIDGAYFGTTFPHLFLMSYYSKSPEKVVSQSYIYVPRVFGFKLHKP